jgi:2-haloacid dehalogenase
VKLSDFKVLTFDCYCTLIDWESGTITGLAPPDRAPAAGPHALRNPRGPRPHRGHSAARDDWPAFPDSGDALRYLKQHFALVILSNVDNESFVHSNARLGVAFDAIYTAADIGSYKPAKRNFEYMLADLGERGVERSDILHVAESLFHDHVPASSLGLASCWIHRRHGDEGFGATRPPGTMPTTDFRFESMAALAAAHQAKTAPN